MLEAYRQSLDQRQMRCVAFIAVVISTAAVIVSVITLPMLYNHVQSFQTHMMAEADFCRVLLVFFNPFFT